MDPMILLLVAIVAYLIFGRSGVSVGGQLFGGTSSNVPAQGYQIGAQPYQTSSQAQGFQLAAQGTAQVTQAVTNQLSQAAQEGSDVAGSLAKAVPIVGAAISAVIGVFAAQSAKRAAQAKDENGAVAQAVPGWDQAAATIAQYYNSGQISAQNASDAIDAIWKNYWNEVTNVIQPGRNGCQGGTVVQPSTVSFCGGKTYGAACCVGYDDLKNSNNNMKAAIRQTENTGAPANAYILPVFASKYGGINRPGYTLTFKRPSSIFGI